MRHAPLLLSLTLTTLTTLAATAQAQTCHTAIQADAPDSRYQAATNGTALDKQSGLIWKRCAEGQTWQSGTCNGTAAAFAWADALARAETATFVGKSDWRLPNQKELQSLVEHRCVAPSINLTAFPNAESGLFWSSSPYAFSYYGAWLVSFSYGNGYSGNRDGSSAVRLVHAGQ